MTELKKSHTSGYIKDLVMDTLKYYEIDMCNIYSVTSDNGANMVKTMKIIDVEVGISQNTQMFINHKEHEENTESKDIGEDEEEYEGIRSLNEDSTQDNEILEVSEIVINDKDKNTSPIRCAAHTLQLAVYHTLKDKETKLKISQCRSICKKIEILQ
ncbi:hypothetical protein BB558_002941 [Smittium angustum]|uniref:HAT C-terminal dimerisation domain-containing protein n=1 Tax=Smittium angustum TaxID=133377 RepID=A0A2U1J7D2_SMIAN|nr:hypothetical protein BB558_002941 [Smittium angustum]